MNYFICHIGFPKTGTTFLQKNIFPKMEVINFISDQKVRSIFDEIIHNDETIYEANAVRKEMDTTISCSNQNVLLSYKPLTGHHYNTSFSNRTQIAWRLNLAGVRKIIITIRNQFDILESTYKQYIKSGGVVKFNDYFSFNPIQKSFFNIQYFNYFKIIQLYTGLFGRENVLVLQYEDLVDNDKKFFNSLCDFLEINSQDFTTTLTRNTNPSLLMQATILLRVINHFTYNNYRPSHLISKKISTNLFYRILTGLSSKQGGRSFITSEHRKIINKAFSDSNQQMEELDDIRLNSKYPSGKI